MPVYNRAERTHAGVLESRYKSEPSPYKHACHNVQRAQFITASLVEELSK